jgi:hypothetical protein
MSGIRAEPRTAMMALVEVCWEELDGTSHSAIQGRMEDTSRSGACIRVSSAIGVGATVWVKRPWEEIAGITRYCRRDGDDYVLGIQRILEWRERKAGTAPVSATKIPPREQRPVVKQEMKNVPKEDYGNSAPAKIPRTMAPTRPAPAPNVSVPAEIVSPRIIGAKAPEVPQIPFASPEPELAAQAVSSGKERRSMSTNWLGAFKRPKEDSPSGKAAPEDSGMADEKAFMDRAPVNGDANRAARVQGDLQSLEDIYRAAGILNPRMGYSISKVVSMMYSDHMRGLATDAKRAAILMALDAASISVEEILRDAELRQKALDEYEASQLESFEEYWARKAEVNEQIQAETDRIVAQNLERMQKNRDEVAQEKAEFARWQGMKQSEAKRISEAVGLCLKTAPPAEAPAAPAAAPSEVAGAKKH